MMGSNSRRLVIENGNNNKKEEIDGNGDQENNHHESGVGGSTINIKVCHGSNQHHLTVPSHSTFGDLKRVIAQETGLDPKEQKLLFRGKEKEDQEHLHMAGVKDNAKVLLMEDKSSKETKVEQVKESSESSRGFMEDKSSKETKVEQVKESSESSRGCEAVAGVRSEVDKLLAQVAALESAVSSGTKVADKDFIVLSELLMRELLNLDSVEAEGEGRVQRKNEAKDDISPEGATAPTSSWSGLFKAPTQDPAQDFRLSHVDIGTFRQERKLAISVSISDLDSHEWHNTLVGFFLDRKLPYSLVTKSTTKFWANAGLIDTLAIDEGTYFFKFGSSLSLEAVLEGGPWYVAGKPIILRKWEPHLSIKKNRISRIPIWVHFFNVPLEYWTQKGLSYIASMIGKPLHVDKMTASRRRITYARICIEVDAKDEWITSFEVVDAEGKNPVTIQVGYQWTPSRCSSCKCFGHDCMSKGQTFHSHAKVQQQMVPVTKTFSDLPPKETSPASSKREEQWIEVARNHRRKGKDKEVHSSELPLESKLGQEPMVSASPNKVSEQCMNSSQEVRVSNSFNGLIPYEYERQEDFQSKDDIENIDEDFEERMAVIDHVEPSSARQKKIEAIKNFSRSRPTGRHRN